MSAERVLTPDVRRLVDAVAARYAGTRADVLRLAIPPRHANVEKETPAESAPPTVTAVDMERWAEYDRGDQFFAAIREGRAARAVWQALPGERWADRLAEVAAATVEAGRGVLAIVPDQRDVDSLTTPPSGSSTKAGWWRFRRGSAPRSGTGDGCRCCVVRPGW